MLGELPEEQAPQEPPIRERDHLPLVDLIVHLVFLANRGDLDLLHLFRLEVHEGQHPLDDV